MAQSLLVDTLNKKGFTLYCRSLMPTIFIASLCLAATYANAQDPATAEDESSQNEEATEVAEPAKVDVIPLAEDSEIEDRLLRILEATEWFERPQVTVDEGVVFLAGRTDNVESKEWATRLANKTQDVVAVVNRIRVTERPLWDLSPAMHQLREMGSSAVQKSPFFLFAILLLVLSWGIGKIVAKAARSVFQRRVQNELLRGVGAKAIAIPVFLLGLYLALTVSGLSNLAMTVIGGTGLLGLAIGIAFRDIAENFLASLLISVERPFRSGDLIEVAGNRGYVQSVTTRGTLLMTLDGNHVQIPNATIYKETITNFTSNPNVRLNIAVGVGFDCSLSRAQEVAMVAIGGHPAVLADPEPLVLVEELGAATVNLRIHAWTDGHQHSMLKVSSALTRLIKQAFEQANISMPDEAREVIMPKPLRVQMLENREYDRTIDGQQREDGQRPVERESYWNVAEGDLSSEASEIQRQADNSRSPEHGRNLLDESNNDDRVAVSND